jgi:hypothetical protein
MPILTDSFDGDVEGSPRRQVQRHWVRSLESHGQFRMEQWIHVSRKWRLLNSIILPRIN